LRKDEASQLNGWGSTRSKCKREICSFASLSSPPPIL
jgi:hypothetical protein